ncbi:Schwannomin-interacting protein 1-like protein [Dinothrombium tinctorium]|uniref:Schwannomin-interacting protein 1-like protein n=1 Tax=Dinothrombium tinctorium TaxID=1965070 RepID=A0A443RB08_9ACAR|nr:Schwannomin-interacting protein 1-like protein [Dinothrombium tinctorium]
MMNTLVKMQAFSRPFDASDYKERSKTGGFGLKHRSFSVNDREEIRRRLAMDADNDDLLTNFRSINFRKSNMSSRIQNGTSLQLCFINEISHDFDYQELNQNQGLDNNKQARETSPNNNEVKGLLDSTSLLLSDTSSQMSDDSDLIVKRPSSLFMKTRNKRFENFISLSLIPKPTEKEHFSTYHSKLYAEARIALSQAKGMAKMQIQIEKQRRKPSPLMNLIQLPFSNRSDNSNQCFNFLFNLGVPQLQLLVNDLHSQIESLNEELVKLLLERDELHMEQDSILVDIEDLTIFL